MDIEPLYRLTVYAPSSEDPTETAVLTPIAGAAHADPFVVTTKQGIAGAQPFLEIGKGRQGSINYTTKRTTTGNLLASLLDRRVTPGGSNAVRWVTAFIGNARGETRLKGCKFLLERALDGTEASLVPFTAGRIRNNGVTRATRFDLELKDFADDLNRPLFKGAPHASIAYAALGPLLPNGVVKPFGNLPLTPPLAATIGAPFSTAPDTVVVNVTTPSDPAAMITQAVLDSNSSTALRVVELTKVADGTKHYYQWPRGDSALASTNIPGGPTPHFGLTAFPIAQLPVGDPRREALPAVGTAVTVSIVQDAPPSEATPLLVNDVHPVQYIADILDGKFSLGPGETTLRPLAVRNTDPGNSWATLLADPSFDTIREVITKLEPKANDYLEKVLLQRYNLVLDRDGRGRVDLVDLRRTPTLAGVVTLTDDDLVTATDPSWDDSRDGAITAVAIDYYVDQRIPPTDLVASSDTFPTLPPALIRSAKSTVLVLNDLSTLKDVGEKVITIAARGDRISSGDLLSAHFGRQRRDRLEGKLKAAALDFLRPIGSGVITAQATYRMASANAQQIAKGKYCIVQHSKLPDPASNERGGARLMLCLSCDERDGTLAVQWMDAGTGAVAVVPNITGVTSANPYSVDVAILLNGDNDPADLYVAATDTTVGVRPADDAAEWVYAGTMTASGTVRIGSLPTGKRIWTRAQSHGTAANVKLPSAWDYAPAPGYLDLTVGPPIDLSQPNPVFTPIATLPPIADVRWTISGGVATVTFRRTDASSEIWMGYQLASGLSSPDWDPVAAGVVPLADSVLSFTVPAPVDGEVTLVQLEARGADLAATMIKRLVITAAPQLPSVELDDLETATTGTQWVRFTERGIAIVSVDVQVQVGTNPISAVGAVLRGPGAASTVKGGVLGSGEYEHDVPLDPTRQSWIVIGYTLANGTRIVLPPFGFDRDRLPNLISVVPDAVTPTRLRITADSDTKSIGIYSTTRSYGYEVDGAFLDVDVAGAGNLPGATNVGLAAGSTDTFLVRAFSEPIAALSAGHLNTPTADLHDDKLVPVFNGAPGDPGAPAASWLTVQAYAPAEDDSAVATIDLRASAAPAGWTVVLLISEEGEVPSVDETANVTPPLAAPPIVLTTYEWTSSHVRTPRTPTTRLVTMRVRAELRDGSGVVQDSRDTSASWYASDAFF